MKKSTVIEIGISVLCILLLTGLGIFLFADSQMDDDSVKEAAVQKDAAAQSGISSSDEKNGQEEAESNAMDAQTAAALAAAQAEASLPEHQIIFVGDSRTVGMANAEKDTDDICCYVGESGEGCQWLVDSGLSLMKAAMDSYPEAPVVLNLGVNDPQEIEKYLTLYQELGELYPEHTFYFMSVNPVTEEAAHITNSQIGDFNARLREAFPDHYLDCYTYMMIKGFESVDGVHYSEDTYRMIHDFAVKQLFL